ncbi:hypothetical protein N7510_011777 [Penicillium lagena]|uniref:uncharacterized protein n=1 Tax=Penicillium lagena TaxID=94218 RepID=UPI00253F99E8|nr:uncharacterized protein N7510_011777 [Penicillium lagena]KAJ5602243.1 hypothetical protein N7510_011777 [Penicillium lagena]
MMAAACKDDDLISSPPHTGTETNASFSPTELVVVLLASRLVDDSRTQILFYRIWPNTFNDEEPVNEYFTEEEEDGEEDNDQEEEKPLDDYIDDAGGNVILDNFLAMAAAVEWR